MEELAFPDHPSRSIHIHPVPITRIWFSFENNVTHVLQSWDETCKFWWKLVMSITVCSRIHVKILCEMQRHFPEMLAHKSTRWEERPWSYRVEGLNCDSGTVPPESRFPNLNPVSKGLTHVRKIVSLNWISHIVLKLFYFIRSFVNIQSAGFQALLW